MVVQDKAKPVREASSAAVPRVVSGPCSTLRDFQEVLDSFNVSAGSFCVVELAIVAAGLLVKSNGCVTAKEANVEFVECRHAADRLRSVR